MRWSWNHGPMRVSAVIFGVLLCHECVAAQEIRYTIEDLGTLPGHISSIPWSINNDGDVVGSSTDSQPRGFLYTDEAGMVELPSPDGRPLSVARAISESGVIVGYAYTSFIDHPGHAWRIVDGVVEDLGTLGGTWSAGYAVNDAGTVVGYSYCSLQPTAFIQPMGEDMFDFTGTCAFSYGHAVSKAGVIAGYRVTPNGWRPYRWTEQTGFQVLPILPGYSDGFGLDMNEAGQVAGYVENSTNTSERMVRITGDVAQDLGGILDHNRAYGINIHGTVVGEGRLHATDPIRGLIYSDERGLEALDDLIDPNAGWGIMSARDINDRGQIACQAQNIKTGQINAVRLTPITKAVPGDITGDGAVNVSDLLAVINAWGACPAPPADCAADIAPSGGDGTVDVIDLLFVINNWA